MTDMADGIFIPNELIPKYTEFDNGQQVRLPPMSQEWSRRPISKLNPEEKARRYLEEAGRSLALARYWAGRSEM